mgnify:CR=1 FL=1
MIGVELIEHVWSLVINEILEVESVEFKIELIILIIVPQTIHIVIKGFKDLSSLLISDIEISSFVEDEFVKIVWSFHVDLTIPPVIVELFTFIAFPLVITVEVVVVENVLSLNLRVAVVILQVADHFVNGPCIVPVIESFLLSFIVPYTISVLVEPVEDFQCLSFIVAIVVHQVGDSLFLCVGIVKVIESLLFFIVPSSVSINVEFIKELKCLIFIVSVVPGHVLNSSFHIPSIVPCIEGVLLRLRPLIVSIKIKLVPNILSFGVV